MKPDIAALCILATTILGTVAGFLAPQSPDTVDAIAAAGLKGHGNLQGIAAAPQRLHLPMFGVMAPHPHLHHPPQDVPEPQERAVYDPGDELLRALNAEQEKEQQEQQAQDLALAGIPAGPEYPEPVMNELELASKFEVLKKLEEDLRAEQELVDKSALLMKMLEDPSLDTLPLVYVEEEDPEAVIASAGAEDYNDVENAGLPGLVLGQSKPKRSRYYRRYPWKRHNKNRGSYMNSINSNYEPELRYACTPSKEDIFKLLVNLHENRKGNHSKTVQFCNRKRPAKAVFTNIRFLG
ncbi:hypothetical protein KR018_007371 [Drosophila ironensis]|nr:hypothetical protein KR018_007371 [Drosophila ironensis]